MFFYILVVRTMALYFIMNGKVTDSDTTIQFVTIGDI